MNPCVQRVEQGRSICVRHDNVIYDDGWRAKQAKSAGRKRSERLDKDQ